MYQRITKKEVETGRRIESTVTLACGHRFRVVDAVDPDNPDRPIQYAWDGENARGEFWCGACQEMRDKTRG